MRKLLAVLVGAVFLAISADGRAEEAPPVRVGPFAFTKVAEKLAAGAVYATFQERNVWTRCHLERSLTADGQLKPLQLSNYAPAFSREIGKVLGAGLSSTNLFESTSDDAEYEVGALIYDASINICRSSGFYDYKFEVSTAIKVQWQIFSSSKRLVVATIETAGSADGNVIGEALFRTLPDRLLQDAFAENAKQLAASTDFKALLKQPSPAHEGDIKTAAETRISLPTAALASRPIKDAVGAVVLIEIGDGHGSGVLVSTDGYVLTDAHVVGTATKVKVRWSDGFETEGQVVRVHKRRDVALIKTDPRSRLPLSLRTTPLQTGETVWAIGTPLDRELQSTVTRGVVSANRIIDGFSFIQSDVGVNHGNSGGPLLDDKGYVVGLTDLSLQPSENTQIGLNFFIPIRDALDFLKLDLTPSSAAGAPSPAPKTAVLKASDGARR